MRKEIIMTTDEILNDIEKDQKEILLHMTRDIERDTENSRMLRCK